MSFSEIPPPAEQNPGNDLPELRVRPPGPQSRTWLTRHRRASAPMGPRATGEIARIKADVPNGSIVLSTGLGSNLIDVDGNRYVDLAQGFGAQLIGHRHKNIQRVLELQAGRLWQALGDVYPSDAKIGVMERLSELYPGRAQVLLIGPKLMGRDVADEDVSTEPRQLEFSAWLSLKPKSSGSNTPRYEKSVRP